MTSPNNKLSMAMLKSLLMPFLHTPQTLVQMARQEQIRIQLQMLWPAKNDLLMNDLLDVIECTEYPLTLMDFAYKRLLAGIKIDTIFEEVQTIAKYGDHIPQLCDIGLRYFKRMNEQ